MHPNNFTLYQLIKYHIELTEALEYTLITYKANESEMIERFKFLKEDYKKGFYHYITSSLFKGSKKLTKEIKNFIKNYNDKVVKNMLLDHNLHSRLTYNQNLYLAYTCSDNIIQVFLHEEEIKKHLEQALLDLLKTTNKHFNLFLLFNSLNMYVSSKAIILQGDELYNLDDNDKEVLSIILTSLEEELDDKSLLNDTLDLIKEKKKFDEDDAYELLNKVSIECIKSENDLYKDFENFSSKLEKEIEKGHN